MAANFLNKPSWTKEKHETVLNLQNSNTCPVVDQYRLRNAATASVSWCLFFVCLSLETGSEMQRLHLWAGSHPSTVLCFVPTTFLQQKLQVCTLNASACCPKSTNQSLCEPVLFLILFVVCSKLAWTYSIWICELLLLLSLLVVHNWLYNPSTVSMSRLQSFLSGSEMQQMNPWASFPPTSDPTFKLANQSTNWVCELFLDLYLFVVQTNSEMQRLNLWAVVLVFVQSLLIDPAPGSVDVPVIGVYHWIVSVN